MFLPHFDVFCDLLLDRHTATWNVFALYNNEKPFLFQNISTQRESQPLPRFCPLWQRRKKSLLT